MNNSKKYTNVITSILLVITIILTILSGFVRFIATNKTIYLKLLENSNTYYIVEEVLSNKMNSLLGSDISEDLKKSIITEEDVRREADVVLDCIISDLISGQSNIPEVDTSIYKERIADALKSLTGYDVKINDNKDLTDNIQNNDYYVTSINAVNNTTKKVNANMFVVERLNKVNNNDLALFNMATRAEIEAQGRAMLEEKGITEEEARQKAAEKGISEEDVWNYLEENGYLDDEPKDSNSQNIDSDTDNSDNDGNLKNIQNSIESESPTNNDSISDESDNSDDKVSKKKIQNIVTSVIKDNNKNFDEKVQEISSKLMDEAEKIINAEMEKLNFSKLIDSVKFKTAIKVTSTLYNSFYMLVAFMMILCMLLIFINKQSIKKGVIMISRSILISGIIMSVIFGSMYLFKIYAYIDINLNKDYFQQMFLQTAQYFSKLLSIVSVVVLLTGLITNIFIMKRNLIRR